MLNKLAQRNKRQCKCRWLAPSLLDRNPDSGALKVLYHTCRSCQRPWEARGRCVLSGMLPNNTCSSTQPMATAQLYDDSNDVVQYWRCRPQQRYKARGLEIFDWLPLFGRTINICIRSWLAAAYGKQIAKYKLHTKHRNVTETQHWP